jgi:hypothetical protein
VNPLAIAAELGVWLGRVTAILPQLIQLWNAAKAADPKQELEAQLALTRAVKDQQAKESLT